MKRKWDTGLEPWMLWIPAGLWALVGYIFFLLDVTKDHHHHNFHWAPWWIALLIWVGPFLLVGIPIAAQWCWHVRPRRVWVPIKEDLRKQ